MTTTIAFRLLRTLNTAFCCVLLTCSMPAFAQVPALMPENKKIQVVLYKLDPWLGTIGSDSPVFALYSDGTVIYCKTDSTTYESKYYSSKLTSEQAMHIYSDLGAVSDKSYYSQSDATDQPKNLLIWFRPDGTKKSVSVEGDIIRDSAANTKSKTLVGNFFISNAESEQSPTSKPLSLRIPAPVLKLFTNLLSFEAKDAKPWLPAYIEILLAPGGAPGGFEWPQDWPNSQDKLTKQRKADNYSVFLKSEHFAELKNLMAKTPFARINGQSWSVDYRFPVPHENLLYPRGQPISNLYRREMKHESLSDKCIDIQALTRALNLLGDNRVLASAANVPN